METSDIKVEVSGGLANQIFMFLGGRWIASESDKNMTLLFTPNKLHSESLLDFDLPYKKSNIKSSLSIALRILRRISRVSANFNKVLQRFGFFFIHEIGLPSNVSLNNEVKFVSGYFQSHEIHKQGLKGTSIFKLLNHVPSNWTLDFIRNSVEPKDIAIHVRLGDYVGERNSIGLVGLSYYSEAICKAMENGGTGVIRVITNDIIECKKFLKPLPFKLQFIEPPLDVPNFDSLYILSNHHYLVLTNSSFSLLAGLESNAKLIIRPTPWFNKLPEPNRLSPPEWISLPSSWR